MNKKALFQKLAPILTLLFVFVSVFFRLGDHHVNEWDEARYAQNANEMLLNGDFVNYFWAGKIDAWNAKPPLLVWLIVGSYQLFGQNEFALRFPSAVAACLTLFYLYWFLQKRVTQGWALLAVLIAATSRGLIGHHVGRSGDMDALLVLGTTGMAFHFIEFLEYNKKRHLILSMLLGGLAFYSKGFVVAFIVPGLLLLTLRLGRVKDLLTQKITYVAGAVFLAFPISWALLVSRFGAKYENPEYIGGNAFSTMILYDVIARFRGEISEGRDAHRFFYWVNQMDTMLSPWSYLLYLSGIFLIWKAFQARSFPSRSALFSTKRPLSLSELSAVFLIPMFLILTASQNKYSWYIAPMIPFFAILMVETFKHMASFQKKIQILLILVAALAVGRQLKYISTVHPAPIVNFVEEHSEELKNADEIILYPRFFQEGLVYLWWTNPNITIAETYDVFTEPIPESAVVCRDELQKRVCHVKATLK